MHCEDFLERYSEFRDRDENDTDVSVFEAHIAECQSCRRYHEVVERGVGLVRSLSGPRPRSDFTDRLRHRIYHADLTAGEPRRDASSPFIPFALAAAALLAGVGVWGPISSAMTPPAVALPGVSAAEPAPPPSFQPLMSGEQLEPGVRNPAFLTRSDLWDQPNALLYEHSPLYHRYREGSLIRTGLH